jgi:bifunctional DNA-binding transcriptional regulator/antitoxin component of YhaV-PrlF toxin-antitoxin module
MTEEGVQMNEETKSVQESTPEIQDESVDYKALYLDEVQNAKKLRKRAQDAETTIQETTKIQETQKVKQMKEQDKYKELYESVAPFKDKWESHESKRRETLLSKLPEEDRESLGQKDLDTLEYIVKLKDEAKPVNPQHSPNQSRNINSNNINKDWTSLEGEEGKKNYEAYLTELAKNR